MKTKSVVFTLALVSLFLALTVAAAPPDARSADSRIAAVTVYLDRAVVTRTTTVELPVGEQTVNFENLPVALTDQSLQASGKGVAGASILDVTVRPVFTETAPNARVKELEEQIKELVRQRRLLDDRGKILDEEYAFVQKMLQASTTVTPVPTGPGTDRVGAGRPTIDEWQKAFGYAEESFAKIVSERQAMDVKREGLQAKQTVAEQELALLRGARGKQSKTVAVRVALTTAGKLDLSIQYAVPSAAWTPSYDARLRSADRTVDLSYFGVVRNGTGEDWKDIALTLSTARPNLGGGAPELRAWITDVARPGELPKQPAPPRGAAGGAPAGGGGRGGANQSFNNSAAVPARGRGAASQEDADDVFAAALRSASVETGVTSATFKIPVSVTVPGNNVMQRVAIHSSRLAANLQFQSTPKMMEAAFLSAYTINSTEFPLLTGPMNTFLDDTFVASSSLKTVMPGEKFELQLGVDDGITVKRRIVNRFTEDTGFTGKNHRVTYEVIVTITNNKTTPERVVFKESTPVARDEKIKVNILTPKENDIATQAPPLPTPGTPTPANQKEVTKEEDGKLVWRVNMKPGEKREFTLKLSIDYPADITLTGLD